MPTPLSRRSFLSKSAPLAAVGAAAGADSGAGAGATADQARAMEPANPIAGPHLASTSSVDQADDDARH